MFESFQFSALHRPLRVAALLVAIFFTALMPHAAQANGRHFHVSDHRRVHQVHVRLESTPPPITSSIIVFGDREIGSSSWSTPPAVEISRVVESPLTIVSGGATRLLRVAEQFIGDRNPTGFHGPWCAAFINLTEKLAGYHPTRSLRAIDKVHDGIRVASPEPGDLAVSRHHVTIFAGWGGRGFIGVGGNQGGGRVTAASFHTYGWIWIRPV
jgi:hypothetical protein